MFWISKMKTTFGLLTLTYLVFGKAYGLLTNHDQSVYLEGKNLGRIFDEAKQEIEIIEGGNERIEENLERLDQMTSFEELSSNNLRISNLNSETSEETSTKSSVLDFLIRVLWEGTLKDPESSFPLMSKRPGKTSPHSISRRKKRQDKVVIGEISSDERHYLKQELQNILNQIISFRRTENMEPSAYEALDQLREGAQELLSHVDDQPTVQ